MMPTLPRRHCEAPGCKALARGNLCDAHRKASTKLYDDTPQRKATHRTLQSQRWRRLRLMHLREHPLCVVCNGPANEVDHITPRRIDDEGIYDPDNLQSMCKACHTRKTRQGL